MAVHSLAIVLVVVIGTIFGSPPHPPLSLPSGRWFHPLATTKWASYVLIGGGGGRRVRAENAEWKMSSPSCKTRKTLESLCDLFFSKVSEVLFFYFPRTASHIEASLFLSPDEDRLHVSGRRAVVVFGLLDAVDQLPR